MSLLCKKLIIVEVIVIFFTSISFAQVLKPPEITIHRLKGSIIIDGYLNEEIWENAAKIDQFYEINPGNMIEPDVKTEVKIVYDDENLYFGVICNDDISKLRATRRKPGKAHLHDDHLEIYINTFIGVEEEYFFSVNPYGNQWDFYAGGGGRFGESWVEDIDIIWFADAKIKDTCWTIEVAIPFKSLRFPSADTHEWRLDFRRSRPRNELKRYSWSPHPHGEFSSFSFMGRLYINERLLAKRKIELLPYFTGGINKALDDTLDFTARMGISGKYYFTYDHVLDWAILPDYSQIESDAPQIDVNTTFALYYPEKRPFFMERKSFFETPIEIFHSRTINDPLGALKFTGGIGNYNVGYIGAYDQHTPWVIPFAENSYSVSSNEKSFSNIVRIKKDVSKSTHIGLLSTNRDLISNGFNHILSCDGIIYFFNNYSLRYQGIVSWMREPDDTSIYAGSSSLDFGDHTSRFDGEEWWGKGFYFNFNHSSKYLNVNVLYKGLSPEFRADNGFIQYNDFESRDLTTTFNFRVNRFYVGSILPGFGIRQDTKFFGPQKEFEKSASLSIQFLNQIYASVAYKLLDKQHQNILFDNMWSYNAYLSASPIKYFSTGIFCTYGRQISYNISPPSLGYIWYPSLWFEIITGKLRMKLSYKKYLLWNDDFNNPIYDTKTFEDEMNWSFTKYLNFRILLQYSSSTEEVFISPLLSFEPTPFTVFYLGSNHDLEWTDRSHDFSDFELIDSKIFIKLQYLFKY
jgi:hypothetical protein